MIRTILHGASAFFVLCFASSVEAKSIWLKCGNSLVGINEASSSFQYSTSNPPGSEVSGKATFTPSSIAFRAVVEDLSVVKVSYVYQINRKSLAYSRQFSMLDERISLEWGNSGVPETGKCVFSKNPYEGNRI